MYTAFDRLRKHLRQLIRDDYWFTLTIVVLVAVASFGLGRASVMELENPGRPELIPTPVLVESQSANVSGLSAEAAQSTSESSIVTFVASIHGSKYHALTCPGAKQISETNKLYFATERDAQAAGYTRAANCPQ